MPILDIILLVILGSFVLYGFYLGLVRMVLGLISSILSIIISVNLYLRFYQWGGFFLKSFSENTGKIISFIIVFIIVGVILEVVFRIIAKILKLVTSLPIISLVNGALGGVLGLVQGVLVIGAVVFVISHYVGGNEKVAGVMVASNLIPIFLKGINWITPFFPDALKMLKSVIVIK